MANFQAQKAPIQALNSNPGAAPRPNQPALNSKHRLGSGQSRQSTAALPTHQHQTMRFAHCFCTRSMFECIAQASKAGFVWTGQKWVPFAAICCHLLPFHLAASGSNCSGCWQLTGHWPLQAGARWLARASGNEWPANSSSHEVGMAMRPKWKAFH